MGDNARTPKRVVWCGARMSNQDQNIHYTYTHIYTKTHLLKIYRYMDVFKQSQLYYYSNVYSRI